MTDGGVRDLAVVASLDIPTYHAGAHPAVLGRKHVPWDADVPIACGGAAVAARATSSSATRTACSSSRPRWSKRCVADALEQEREEEFIAEQVAAGEKIDGLFPMNAEWKERYRAWLTQQ